MRGIINVCLLFGTPLLSLLLFFATTLSHINIIILRIFISYNVSLVFLLMSGPFRLVIEVRVRRIDVKHLWFPFFASEEPLASDFFH